METIRINHMGILEKHNQNKKIFVGTASLTGSSVDLTPLMNLWGWMQVNRNYINWNIKRKIKGKKPNTLKIYTIKQSNMCILGTSEGKERKSQKKYLKKKMAKNFEKNVWHILHYMTKYLREHQRGKIPTET